MKNNKGITLIALIATVIVLLIIVGIGTSVGMDTVKHSRVLAFVSNMQIIQRKVDEIIQNNNAISIGEEISDTGKQDTIMQILNDAEEKGEIQVVNIEDFRYFSKEDIVQILDISNIDDEILINFKTREVVSLKGVEYNKEEYSGKYYTQYLLPTGQQLIMESSSEPRTKSFEIEKIVNGLSASININNISITNGTLSYKEDDEGSKDWIIITNYTQQGKSETVNITKTANYTFKLTDNADNSEYEVETNIVLTNAPVLNDELTYVKEEYDYSGGINSQSGATAKNGGNIYVWVPRFAYNANKEIKYIKGNSSITTDNEVLKDGWKVPEEFSNLEGEGYLESIGIWVREEQVQSLMQKYLLNN